MKKKPTSKVKSVTSDLLCCSFCNKSSGTVKNMVAGPTKEINICNECIDLCHEIIYGVKTTNIALDKDALRFSFSDGSGVNLFWINLFSPMPNQTFQDEILRCLFKAYNECVKNEAT